MDSVLNQPAKNKSIDWLQAKMMYVQNNTLSYADVAKRFGVSTRQVQRRGSDENWVECRQDVVNSAEIMILERTIDERAATNDRHRKLYREIQSMIHTYMRIINQHNKSVVEKAKTEGTVVDPKNLYSAANLHYLTQSLVNAIEGERVTMDLPTVVVAQPGYKVSHVIEYTPEAQELIASLQAIGVDFSDQQLNAHSR